MRDEINKALYQARKLNYDLKVWSTNQTDQNIFPNEDHPIAKEINANHEQMQRYRILLQNCLANASHIKEVLFASASMLTVYWDNSKAHAVIELSLYGPIAAIFYYGEISSELEKQINKCIASSGLIKINVDEVRQMNKQDPTIYKLLFE